MRSVNPAPAETALDSGQPPQRILVVEDLDDARTSMQEMLKLALKAPVDVAADGAQGLQMLLERPYSVVITDLRMPRLDGMRLIEEVQARHIPVTVIVTTGHGSVNQAVQAMRLGAYDFLTKPADPQHLVLLVQRALRERNLLDEVVALRARLQGAHSFQNVLSKNPRMLEIFELIGHMAATTTTVLIEGETGTGKEQIARAIHRASAAQRPGPLVAVSCAALPETLLESELFGHEKGSFTGATVQRIGRFEQANHGTLFLDEIGDVPASMQVKLLRVLQDRKFERVGGTETIDVDVRVIAATNRSLEGLVKDGKFREDLFYRLNVIRIDLPPLRDRPEDIPLLADHFAQKYARTGLPNVQIAPEAHGDPAVVRLAGQRAAIGERHRASQRDGSQRTNWRKAAAGRNRNPGAQPADGACRSVPAAGRSARRIDGGVRGELPAQSDEADPRARRPLRADLRTFPAQHHRQTRPISHR